jgi:hypothetical protein
MSANPLNHWFFLLEFVFKFHKIIFVVKDEGLWARLQSPRYEVMWVWRENGKVNVEFTHCSYQLSLFHKL